MQRRVVAITKPPEFGADGQPIPGQCEPHTDGWRLCLRGIERREEEVLLSGTYRELRLVQLRCVGRGPDEVRAIAAESRQALEAARAKEDEDTKVIDLRELRQTMRDIGRLSARAERNRDSG